jgi:hypothetical protein
LREFVERANEVADTSLDLRVDQFRFLSFDLTYFLGGLFLTKSAMLKRLSLFI